MVFLKKKTVCQRMYQSFCLFFLLFECYLLLLWTSIRRWSVQRPQLYCLAIIQLMLYKRRTFSLRGSRSHGSMFAAGLCQYLLAGCDWHCGFTFFILYPSCHVFFSCSNVSMDVNWGIIKYTDSIIKNKLKREN